MIAQALKSRTVLFGLLIVAISAAQGFVPMLRIPVEAQIGVNMAIGVIVVYLRFLTTQPISEK